MALRMRRDVGHDDDDADIADQRAEEDDRVEHDLPPRGRRDLCHA